MPADVIEIGTPGGTAHASLDRPRRSRSLLILGHGAGGGVDSADLLALRDAAVAAAVAVARVTQPYRVAGRRAPAPAARLDEAWLAAVSHLRRLVPRAPLLVGGRSSGARVACRTAVTAGARGVVALAFPLHPPGRPGASRAAELATGLPTLVVNGDRDPFGVPDPEAFGARGSGARAGAQVEVRVRPGERHDLRRDPAGTAATVVTWLAENGWAAG